MGDKEDYLTAYRVFFENFAATVNPEDQLPVHIAGYTITEAELPGEVLYWTTQYLTEKQCPPTLMTPLRRIILDEVRVASKKQPNDFGYKSDESVYIALRLMQAVTARVIDVCLRYLDNSKLDTLPPPPPLEQRDLKTVSCATKNSRRVMEDRHVEIGNLEALFGIETTEPTSFYAVYDGHAGSAAATYCAAHLHQYLVESQHFRNDLQRAMRDAFLRTDVEFVRKSNQERACGGSTAVAVAVRGRRLLAAWAGDSLALLAKRMRLMQLVRPHKPSRQDERERIESSGGTVMYWGTWRVNGQLAVSRAIGDAQYKPYVTARPEIATVDLDGDEDFVVVACDGLWDFVSEDDVALAVYRQLAIDPDDLKAVTKRLVVQAKRQGSADNISIIVVFLKDPRAIAADNCPPMELGLDNALANTFAMEAEACKRQLAADGGECAEPDADNGVDNSDSDSEDLGPETAVDIDIDGDADDVDADTNHEPAAPTPPADTVEEGHVDGVLVDNVAESGEESEDEWNYFKGEGEREENPSEEPDEPPRSPTSCQDNSAWESSSVDMNSSPLNPDAPVFVPGSVAGADLLLAESPRKPMPMDDIELPDVKQFETGAIVRPAELLDLDNCDQLNGHHNVSLDEAGNEKLNGNEKCNMDSLGFGFGVGVDTDKLMDKSLIQDFERIQKDTTDFCNIQVFQTHTETNPFASDATDELFERLKNKERDPMSMSFYQEKDDDTCERLGRSEPPVDLNAVQPLPDSDDEDIQPNGLCDNITDHDKENIAPEQETDLMGTDVSEPNNDIMRFDCRTDVPTSEPTDHFGQGDNFVEYNVSNTNNMQGFEFESSNISQNTILQTDTPESHKLLFEQIPEIPDGKSSELGFTNEDVPSESEKDARAFTPQEETSHDVDMESKSEDSPCVEEQPELPTESQDEHVQATSDIAQDLENKDNEIMLESALSPDEQQHVEPFTTEAIEDEKSTGTFSPEVPHDTQENIVVDVHQNNESYDIDDIPEIRLETERGFADTPVDDNLIRNSPLPCESPMPAQSPLPSQSPMPSEAPEQAQSPPPSEALEHAQSPPPSEALEHAQSPRPSEALEHAQSPPPSEALEHAQSPLPSEALEHAQSPLPVHSPEPVDALQPAESPLPQESPLPAQSPLLDDALRPVESPLPAQSPLLAQSPIPSESKSPVPEANEYLTAAKSPTPVPSPVPAEEAPVSQSPIPVAEEPSAPEMVEPTAPIESVSPVPPAHEAPSPLPAEVPLPRDSPPPATELALEPTIPSEEPLIDTAPVDALRPETASPVAAEPEFTQVTKEESLAARLTPELTSEDCSRLVGDETSGPAPDIVPEEPPRAELVTDIDIGIPELRAQEICVPVTSEIQLDDAVQTSATPPPTPAAQHDAAQPPLSDTPIAADAASAAAALAAGAAVAAAAVATAKAKTTAKKSPTTPSAAKAATPKTATKVAPSPRAPASATKKPAAATPARASTASKPATPASRTTTPAAKPAAAKPASAKTTTTRTSAAKPAPALKSPTSAREAPAAAKAAAPARAAPAKPAAPRPPISRPAPALAKPAPPAAAAARPATARPAAARPAPRPAAPARPASATTTSTAAKPRELKPKAPEKKPLTNGDVKDAKPAAKAPARPATAPARPAPRAAPRVPAAPTAAAPAKTAAPKPAPRATKPLDKQTKDLANKRITAKAAPPRTAATKAPIKGTTMKPVTKKPLEPPPQNGLSNGEAPEKAAPSPPPDNALLPDVIA